ncbi:MAG: hypothetical protein PQJ61_02625 [Spirochaetales bacterium]|uniref:DUF2232 domain-containing protein n=1 Tax=Candidatus Thalassospirochaeta sargassi TaxID=3119039 RepID=A0AAJ1IE16_9SPIO|nr:hypothetical protein [Spirochaetales bacterium]
MLQFQGSSRLRELSAAVILSVVFSQIGFLVLLFTVPLYTLYYRRGSKDLLIGAGSVIVILLVLTVWKTRSVLDTDLRGALVLIEMVIPVLLMLGMFFVIDIIPGISGFRRLYRLFIATGAAVLVFVPVFMLLMRNEVFIEAVGSQITAIAGVFLGEGSETFESEVMKTYLGEEGILGYMRSFYMRSAAAMLFLILLIGARASEMIMFRLQKTKVLPLTEFRVPLSALWPMLLAAGGMLVEIFELVDLSYASPFIWNAGLILMFIYGLQGLGIIRSLFGKFNTPHGLRVLVEMILVIILMMPGVNYIVIIGLPVLGISETWINLRKPIRST